MGEAIERDSYLLVLIDMARRGAESPEQDLRKLARSLLRGVTAAQLRELAIRDLVEWIDDLRREKARKIEKAAVTPAPEPPPSRPSYPRPDKPWYVGNYKDRQAFRKSMSPENFDEWFRKTRELAAADPDPVTLEMFEEDWHPGGVRARQREVMWAEIHKMMQDHAETIRLETTAELLSTVFALGDGLRVTWGAATIDQHAQRIQLLMGNATGNVETAARHQVAIRMIEAAGKRSLDELAVVPESAAA